MACTLLIKGPDSVAIQCTDDPEERWIQSMVDASMASQAEEEHRRDLQRELELDPYQENEWPELVECELLPEVQGHSHTELTNQTGGQNDRAENDANQ